MQPSTGTRLAHSPCEAHALLSPTQARTCCRTMMHGSPDIDADLFNATSAADECTRVSHL